MLYRSSIGALALAAALGMVAGAQAFDEAKYPDWTASVQKSVRRPIIIRARHATPKEPR